MLNAGLDLPALGEPVAARRGGDVVARGLGLKRIRGRLDENAGPEVVDQEQLVAERRDPAAKLLDRRAVQGQQAAVALEHQLGAHPARMQALHAVQGRDLGAFDVDLDRVDAIPAVPVEQLVDRHRRTSIVACVLTGECKAAVDALLDERDRLLRVVIAACTTSSRSKPFWRAASRRSST